MKKVISLITVLMLVFTMTCSVFAADTFVPSISYKDNPIVVPVDDGNGNKVVGVIRDADGNVIDHLDDECIFVASIAEAMDNTIAIPEDIRDLLTDVYAALEDGSMKLPYDKLDTDLDDDEIIIRELIDVTVVCDEHAELIAQDGITVDITFDLGVDEDASVFVFAYVDGEWVVVEVVNNGDGTVTGTFEDVCPIAFCVAEEQPEVPSWVELMWEALTNWLSKFFR